MSGSITLFRVQLGAPGKGNLWGRQDPGRRDAQFHCFFAAEGVELELVGDRCRDRCVFGACGGSIVVPLSLALRGPQEAVLSTPTKPFCSNPALEPVCARTIEGIDQHLALAVSAERTPDPITNTQKNPRRTGRSLSNAPNAGVDAILCQGRLTWRLSENGLIYYGQSVLPSLRSLFSDSLLTLNLQATSIVMNWAVPWRLTNNSSLPLGPA